LYFKKFKQFQERLRPSEMEPVFVFYDAVAAIDGAFD